MDEMGGDKMEEQKEDVSFLLKLSFAAHSSNSSSAEAIINDGKRMKKIKNAKENTKYRFQQS